MGLEKKLKPDGGTNKYESRLVAKGFRQKKNLDFFDTLQESHPLDC